MSDTDKNRTAEDQAENTASRISDDMLIILPVRNLVLFPGTVLPVAINRDRSLAGAQEAVRTERKVGFLLQHDPDTQVPTSADLYKVGTVANIVRYVTAPDGSHHVVCQGEKRFQVVEFLGGWPFLVARFRVVEAPMT